MTKYDTFSAIKLEQKLKDTKKSRVKREKKVATHSNAVKTKLERSEETRSDNAIRVETIGST